MLAPKFVVDFIHRGIHFSQSLRAQNLKYSIFIFLLVTAYIIQMADTASVRINIYIYV